VSLLEDYLQVTHSITLFWDVTPCTC